MQALGAHLSQNVFACVRQPSQGPTFGIKGINRTRLWVARGHCFSFSPPWPTWPMSACGAFTSFRHRECPPGSPPVWCFHQIIPALAVSIWHCIGVPWGGRGYYVARGAFMWLIVNCHSNNKGNHSYCSSCWLSRDKDKRYRCFTLLRIRKAYPNWVYALCCISC